MYKISFHLFSVNNLINSPSIFLNSFKTFSKNVFATDSIYIVKFDPSFEGGKESSGYSIFTLSSNFFYFEIYFIGLPLGLPYLFEIPFFYKSFSVIYLSTFYSL